MLPNSDHNILVQQMKELGIDPSLIREFIENNLEVSQECFELTRENMSEHKIIRKERMLSHVSIFLSLLRYPKLS